MSCWPIRFTRNVYSLMCMFPSAIAKNDKDCNLSTDVGLLPCGVKR